MSNVGDIDADKTLPRHDLLTVIFTCRLRRIQRLSPDTRVVTSVALLKWAIGNGWAWPTTDKDGHVDRFAACNLAAEGGCLLRPYNTLVPTAAATCWPPS